MQTFTKRIFILKRHHKAGNAHKLENWLKKQISFVVNLCFRCLSCFHLSVMHVIMIKC